MHDELTGGTYHWGRDNYVRLDPGGAPAHIVVAATVPADRRVTHVMIVNEPVHDTFEDTPAKDRDPDWFKRAVFYEVLVRSFQDSNGDGIGDLKGLTAKLDYLQWLGIDCLWLPPFFKSPLRDGGYDVSDYTAVLPEFGDLADFVEFVDAAHQRGMRVIIDFVMNHTSDQHPWFQAVPQRPGRPVRRLLRLGRRRQAVPGRPDHLRRHRDLQLDLRPGPQAVLLAPVLLPPAGPELREPARCRRRSWPRCGSGWTSASTGSGWTPCRTCTSGRAPTARTCRRPTSSSSGSARRSTRDYPDTVLLAEANQWPEDVVDYFGDSAPAATSATWRSTSR